MAIKQSVTLNQAQTKVEQLFELEMEGMVVDHQNGFKTVSLILQY